MSLDFVVPYFVAGDDGNIEWFGTCSIEQVTSTGGGKAKVGQARPETHYVDALGRLREYTEDQRISKASQPSISHRWDNSSMQWVSMLSLEDQRAMAWSRIKAAREAAINERTITTPMGVFDADEAAVANILKALAGWREAQSLGIAPDAMTWTMADNSTRQLTLPELGMLAVLLLQRGEQAYETARALRQQIEAATTTAELDAITWPA